MSMSKLNLLPIIGFNTLSGSIAGFGLKLSTQNISMVRAALDALPQGGLLPSPDTMHLLACLLIGGLIQFVITWAWSQSFRFGIGLVALTFLVIGGTASVTSAFLSATTLVFGWHEQTLTQQMQREAVAPVVQALEVVSGRFTDLSSGVSSLSREADGLKYTEETRGGTCEGDKPIARPGPRSRMRDRHAGLLRTAADDAVAVSEKAEDLMVDLYSAKPEAVDEIYRGAVRMARTSEIGRIRATLARIRDELTNGFVEPGKATRYTCPTPAFLAQVTAAEALLAQAIEIPKTPPLVEDARIDAALEVLVMSAAARIGLTEGEELDGLGFGFLIGALLVEILQIGLIVNREGALRRSGQLADRFEEFWKAPRRLPPRIAAMSREMMSALLTQVLYVRGRPYFVTATPPSLPDQRVIEFFELDAPNQAHREVPLSRLKPEWVHTRPDLAQSDLCQLYPLPNRWRSWLRRAVRDTGMPAGS